MKRFISVVILMIILLNTIGCSSNNIKANITETNEIHNVSVNSISNERLYSEIDAINTVNEYLLANNLNIPSNICVDHKEEGNYIVHCFDVIDNHNVTSGWYSVNINTLKVTVIF